MKHSKRRFGALALAVGGMLGVGVLPASATSSSNWSSYLNGPAHTSYNAAATAITTANASSLKHDWTWSPPAATKSGQPWGILASPTVVNGDVYIGANTGIFYALNASGKVLWSRNLGYVTGTTCGPLGIVSTATVEDNASGVLTVYVAGGDGYLYALNAATGAVEWKSVIAIPSTTEDNYYDWSSPLVVGGNVYVGQSSNCDSPLINGGEKEYNQTTGALENFYQTYPGHSTQPSIWSSAAYDSNGVFVTTGNGPGGDQVSIVRLNPTTMAKEDSWAIPKAEQSTDSDFGGSPTLFTAAIGGVSTPLVGACNKNGNYYVWKQTNLAAGPVWQDPIGRAYNHGETECDAAAIYNGADLFAAGNGTTIGGTAYAGDLEELNPATGAAIWKLGLAGPPIGSPSMDGSGVVAVTEYGIGSSSKSYVVTLVNAATGKVLATFPTGPGFGQPVFSGTRIYIPTANRGLLVYGTT